MVSTYGKKGEGYKKMEVSSKKGKKKKHGQRGKLRGIRRRSLGGGSSRGCRFELKLRSQL